MNTERYENMATPSVDFTATHVLARMIDSIIFRYYWATKGLTEKELVFRPVDGSMNMEELLVHIHGMSLFVLRFYSQERISAREIKSPKDLIDQTLEYYTQLSDFLKKSNVEDISHLSKTHPRSGFEMTSWHFINGPVADALTHIGQIVSWRRIAGNPQMPGVNPFKGVREG